MKGLQQKYTIAITCFIICISSQLFSQQQFQGKAYYISKTSLDMDNFGRPDMSEDQKKRMAERLKSMFEKTYTLDFNKTTSIYKIEEKLAAPTQQGGGPGGGRFGSMMSGAIDGDKYKNTESKELLVSHELLGKKFLIKDELPKLEWKMTGEVKKIGQYMCFKATAVKTWAEFEMPSFGKPPKKEDEKTEKKEPIATDVTAWYTLQIPVNHGPGDYWGLPGLILEVTVDKTIILCSKIVLNPKEDVEIKKPSKGKEVTQAEYTEIATKKFQEMRENFRKRGGNNSRRR